LQDDLAVGRAAIARNGSWCRCRHRLPCRTGHSCCVRRWVLGRLAVGAHWPARRRRSRWEGTIGCSAGCGVAASVGLADVRRVGETMLARDIMTRTVVTVTAETGVPEAATLLASRGFTALPVVDGDGVLIGLLTEVDILRDRFPRDPRFYCSDEGSIARPDTRRPAVTVGGVMTAPCPSVGDGVDVVDLVAVMRADGLRSMPVVDGPRLVGIVTRRDLVRTLTRDDLAVATDVRHQLEIYGGQGPTRSTIVVGVDGSTSARHAALWAADEAARRHLRLRLVFANNEFAFGSTGGLAPSRCEPTKIPPGHAPVDFQRAAGSCLARSPMTVGVGSTGWS
jgi:CBS domain-containing protein